MVTADAALLIGFLNTVELPDGIDALAGSTPEQWLADGRHDSGRADPDAADPVGPAPVSEPVRSADLDRLRTVREAVRVLTRDRPEPADNDIRGQDVLTQNLVVEATAALSSVPLVLDLGAPGSGPALQPMNTSDRRLAAVAAAYLRADADGSFGRVRTCDRPDCRWAFWDSSRNGSRRWCSMADCGNLMKNRSYRARRRINRTADVR